MSRYVSSSVRCDVSRLLQYLRLSSLRRMAPFIPYSKKLSMPAPTPLKPGASHCPCVAPMVLPSRLCVDRRFQRARYARWAKVLTHVKSSNPIEMDARRPTSNRSSPVSLESTANSKIRLPAPVVPFSASAHSHHPGRPLTRLHALPLLHSTSQIDPRIRDPGNRVESRQESPPQIVC